MVKTATFSPDAPEMNHDQKSALAQLYVARSNDHDLSGLMKLFDEFATYQSSKVGTFTGREEIKEMLAEFMGLFPDVRWDVYCYDNGPADSIEFEFKMTATHAPTGETVERRGCERIAFTSKGKIRQIVVTIRDT